MCKSLRITATTAAIGIAALSLTAPAHAGNGSAVGAGLLGFGIGAIVGSAVTPPAVYVAIPIAAVVTVIPRDLHIEDHPSAQQVLPIA